MPLLLMLLFQQVVSAPPDPATSSSTSWSNFRAAVNQQSLQTVLISIEERLRALDTLYSPRYTPRWEISIEQQTRRMDTIESRLGRLETLLELRLDKLSETISARQLKEELSKDQINRKIDSTYERLNHRLGYLEARLDVGISKLQSTIDTGIGRMERMESTAMGRQGDMGTELNGIESGIDEVKKQLSVLEERYNSSLSVMVEHGKHIAIEVNNLTTRMEDLHTEFNKTQSGNEQNDDEGKDTEKNINMMLDKITSGIDRHANNFITKANNMYNDMWRRTQQLEGLAKDTMSLSNATRRELQDGIRTIALQMGRRGLFQSDRERQEGSMDIALDTLGHIQRRLNELGRKFDSNFQMLILAQNLFLESCHRIQLEEPQLEIKLTKVLERILDTITNRSVNTDREVTEMVDLLKSHNAHMTRSIGHTTNTVMLSSERSSQLQVELLSVKEQLLEGNKYIEDAISDIREEKLTASEKIDNIAIILQEVQDSVGKISVATQEGNKVKEEPAICPDSEQIALQILSEVQRKRTKLLGNITEFDEIFGDEEGFGEEINKNAESDLDHQEENTIQEEETIMEGKRNDSSIGNVTAFQLQHRFDVQTNRDDDYESPHVTIQIVRDSANFRPTETENEEMNLHEIFPENIITDPENSLFKLDLQNVAAIIQDSDPSTEEEKQKPILTIVQTILKNGSTNNLREILSDANMQSNDKDESSTTLAYANNTSGHNHTNGNESIQIPMDNISETKQLKRNISLILVPPLVECKTNCSTNYNATIALENVNNIGNSSIFQDALTNSNSMEHNANIQTTFLTRNLTQLYNLTNGNSWRTLFSKLKTNQSDTLNEDEFNNGEDLMFNPKLTTSFSIDSEGTDSLTMAVNDNKDVQRQHYFAKLQELADELVNRTMNTPNEENKQMSDR